MVEIDSKKHDSSNPEVMHQVIPLLDLEKSKLNKVITKSKQLCEFLPNLTIYESELSVAIPPL